MSKKKMIINGNEKIAMLVVLFSKFSKFCSSILCMNLLFTPYIVGCFFVLVLYWIYCNWMERKFESDYINVMERIIYHKIISKIDKEDYENYVQEHQEYFRVSDS